MKNLLYVLVTIMLVLAAGAGMFAYRQGTINDLNAKNRTLTSDIKKLQTEKKTTPSSDSPMQQTTPTSTTYTSEKGVSVIVTSPSGGTKVTSPLTVTGSVPGSWSFEAQFPVRLIDSQGNLLDESPAKLQGDWMTDKHVPFSAVLSFGQGASNKGTLVLLKDNPSGLAQNNDSVVIPVEF